jgi:predicted regulator of Ras-like GTPase activity (Roadblock/LC7/MglB family)
MPRFYFDITDGPKTGRDDEGLEFRDLKAARAAALATLGEIAKDELPDGDRRDFQISIRDESGEILLKALLALRVENPP